jgi:hypothetical protein
MLIDLTVTLRYAVVQYRDNKSPDKMLQGWTGHVVSRASVPLSELATAYHTAETVHM